MTVQKQFLQWTVAVSPDTAPRRVALVAQAYLSEHIFEEFPRIRRQNPSGEFWASGALILSGANPAPEQIASFIQSTRKKQGIPTTL